MVKEPRVLESDRIGKCSAAARSRRTEEPARLGPNSQVLQWLTYTICGLSLYVAVGSSSAETVVNTYTTGRQVTSAVAADGQGRFIVVWASQDQDGDGLGIFGQRLEADGQPLGQEFVVNDYTTGDQERPRVAANADGSFVVVWQGQTSAYRDDVFGRRFDSAGLPIGGQFQVNESTSLTQYDPTIALADDGSFLVAWSNDDRLAGRHFDSSGLPTTGELAIAVDDVGDPTGFRNFFEQDAEALPSGDFVIVWNEYYYPGKYFIGYDTVEAAILDQNAALITKFEASAGSVERKRRPASALNSEGGFVVVWAAYTNYDQNSTILGRSFSSDGTPQTPIFDPTPTGVTELQPEDVAAVGTDRFLVIWDDPRINERKVEGRYVATDGTVLGEPFQINTDDTIINRDPAVASVGADTIITWSRGDDPPSSSNVVASIVGQIFRDGFESGDTSAWNSTVTP